MRRHGSFRREDERRDKEQHTVCQVDHVQSLGTRKIPQLRHPEVHGLVRMTAAAKWSAKHTGEVSASLQLLHLPMKHDPLGRSRNAIMALIQGRELGKNGIVVVRHFGGCGWNAMGAKLSSD